MMREEATRKGGAADVGLVVHWPPGVRGARTRPTAKEQSMNSYTDEELHSGTGLSEKFDPRLYDIKGGGRPAQRGVFS